MQTVHAPDTQMLYAYLKYFNGVMASHTSGTLMGTDWRDNDALVEPAVEIYQGDRQNYEMPDAPRSNNEKDSIGGWRPKGFIDLALAKGYKLSFEASSDHVSTHMSYANIYVTGVTREAVLDGFKKRHLYASTDNILADVSQRQIHDGRPVLDRFAAVAAGEAYRHRAVLESLHRQRRKVRLHARTEGGQSRFLLAGHGGRIGQDELLLRARRAGERRNCVGLADVDHLHRQMMRLIVFLMAVLRRYGASASRKIR